MKHLVMCTIAVGLSACSVQITKSDVSNANYGEPPIAPQTAAIRYFQSVLIDPDSMKLNCNEPKKGWARDATLYPPKYGYVMNCAVNARNQLGGYTGSKSRILLFQNGRLAGVYENDIESGWSGQGKTFGFAE